MSPAMAAAAAISGHITDVRKWEVVEELVWSRLRIEDFILKNTG